MSSSKLTRSGRSIKPVERYIEEDSENVSKIPKSQQSKVLDNKTKKDTSKSIQKSGKISGGKAGTNASKSKGVEESQGSPEINVKRPVRGRRTNKATKETESKEKILKSNRVEESQDSPEIDIKRPARGRRVNKATTETKSNGKEPKSKIIEQSQSRPEINIKRPTRARKIHQAIEETEKAIKKGKDVSKISKNDEEFDENKSSSTTQSKKRKQDSVKSTDDVSSPEKRPKREAANAAKKLLEEVTNKKQSTKSGRARIAQDATSTNDKLENNPEERKSPKKKTRNATKTLEKDSSSVVIKNKPTSSITNKSNKGVTTKNKNTKEILKDDSKEIESTSKGATKTKPTITSNKTNVPIKNLRPEEIEELAYLSDNSDKEIDKEEDEEVSFKNQPNKNQVEIQQPVKKQPIYMRSVEPQTAFRTPIFQKKITTEVADDPYEMSVDEDEEIDKKKKKKVQKRTKRKPKKQAGLILAFGSAQKSQVAPVLKQIKNLKTPIQKVDKPKVNKPAPVNETPKIIVSMHEEENNDDIYQDGGIDYYEPPDQNEESSQVKETISANCPQKQYLTPVVSKRMKKVNDKASTPKENAKKTPTKAELIKNCFGFDESTDNDDSKTDDSKTDDESLVGFSPVKGVNVQNRVMMTPAAKNSRPSNSFTQVKNSTANAQYLKSSSSVLHAPPSSESKAKPFRFEFKMPVNYKHSANNSRPNTNQSQPFQVINREISDKSKKECSKRKQQPKVNADHEKVQVNNEDAEEDNGQTNGKPSSWTTVSEISLYSDLIDESEPPPEINVIKGTETEPESMVEPPPAILNAFEVLTNVKKDEKKQKQSKKTKPLKTVTNTIKATKQSLIYENDGGNKKMKSHRAKVPSSTDSDENTSQMQRSAVSKTYKRNQLNTSITATTSPVKKNTKRDKQVKKWADTTNSQFSEIDAFDLTFN